MWKEVYPLRPKAPPKTSNLTALLQTATHAGNPTLQRCPPPTLSRLHHLNKAEVVTLFTPLVPHSPDSPLAKDMDPFEPLGRAVHRQQVRHVPYRLDAGMTEPHADFLPASGAVVLIACAADNVLEFDPGALASQLRFCSDVLTAVEGAGREMEDVPVVLLVVASGDYVLKACLDACTAFPVVATLDEYSPDALGEAAKLVFGK